MNQAEVKRRQTEAFTNILALITILIIERVTEIKGIAYLALAVEVYALLWTCASGKLSDTLGRLLRGRKNKGQYGNMERMRKYALLIQAVLGLTGCLVMLIFAENIAQGIFGIQYSTLLFRVLSPIVLLRSISAVLVGYFQGESSELPRAISGILRQIFILGFGLLFSGMMRSYGEKVSGLLMQENFMPMYGGVGIAIAICLSEILIIVFLVILFKGSRRGARKMHQERYTESVFDCIRALYVGRWPVLVTGILQIMPMLLGLLFFIKAAEDGNRAVLEYGVYIGKYLTICGIAICLISILSLPVIARILMCLRNGENRFAKKVFQSGVHICMVHGIFISVFLTIMGGEASNLLCPDDADILQKMFMGGSVLILFAVLVGYFVSFLQAVGKKYLVLGAAGAADLVFVLFVLIFSRAGKAGILSLVYGGLAAMAVYGVILGLFAYRQLRTQADWLWILIVPLGAGGVAGIVCMLLGKLLSPHMGSLITLAASFVAGGVVYWLVLLVLRNFKEQELEVITGGRLVEKIGQLLHVF